MTARQKKYAAIITQLIIAIAIINVSPRLRDPMILVYVGVSLVLWYQSVWKRHNPKPPYAEIVSHQVKNGTETVNLKLKQPISWVPIKFEVPIENIRNRGDRDKTSGVQVKSGSKAKSGARESVDNDSGVVTRRRK